MKRDQSKDLFERIGIAAIVVSLAFVAYEVRQNTNAVRSNVIQSVSQQSIDSIARAIDSEELRKAIAASLAGNATPEQRVLMDLQFTIYLRIQTNRYLQSELGVISREMVIAVGGRNGGAAYRRADFREFWERNKSDYTDGFQAYMTEYVLN